MPEKKKKKTENQPNQGSTKSHDIQVMFQAQIRRQQETTKNDNNTYNQLKFQIHRFLKYMLKMRKTV